MRGPIRLAMQLYSFCMWCRANRPVLHSGRFSVCARTGTATIRPSWLWSSHKKAQKICRFDFSTIKCHNRNYNGISGNDLKPYDSFSFVRCTLLWWSWAYHARMRNNECVCVCVHLYTIRNRINENPYIPGICDTLNNINAMATKMFSYIDFTHIVWRSGVSMLRTEINALWP